MTLMLKVAGAEGYAAAISTVSIAEVRRTGQAANHLRRLRFRLTVIPAPAGVVPGLRRHLSCMPSGVPGVAPFGNRAVVYDYGGPRACGGGPSEIAAWVTPKQWPPRSTGYPQVRRPGLPLIVLLLRTFARLTRSASQSPSRRVGSKQRAAQTA